MRKIALPLLFILFSFLSVNAQITHEQSIDVPVREDRRKECMPIGKDGLLLLDAAPGVSKRNWELSHYDENLSLKRKVAIRLPGDYQYNMAFANTDQTHFHFLFNQGEKIHLATYNKTTGSIKELSTKLTNDGTITRLESLNEHIYIVISTWNSTTLDYLNSLSGAIQEIALPNAGKKIKITDIFISKDENLIALSLLHTEVNKERQSRIAEVQFFETNGKTADKALQIKSEIDHNIIQAEINYINRSHIIITGSYADNKDDNAQGIFFTSFENGEQKYIQYYPFKDIPNFFSIFNAKKNEPLFVNRITNVRPNTAKVVLHDLQKVEDAYLFTIEAYLPQYDVEFYDGRKAYHGSKIRKTFVGNFYTHATVLKINKKGEKEGQSIFTLNFNDLNPLPVKHLNVFQKNNITSFVFRRGNKMYLATLDKGTLLQESVIGAVQDEEKRNIFSFREDFVTTHWYDDYFIIYAEKDMIDKKEKRADFRKHIYQIDKKKIVF